jgi:hypothetical protein
VRAASDSTNSARLDSREIERKLKASRVRRSMTMGQTKPGWLGEEVDTPAFPRQHGRQASDLIYRKRPSALCLCGTRKRVLLLRKSRQPFNQTTHVTRTQK